MNKRKLIILIAKMLLATMLIVLAVKATHIHVIESISDVSQETARDDCPICSFLFSPCDEIELTTPKTHIETIIKIEIFIPDLVEEGVRYISKVRPPPVIYS